MFSLRCKDLDIINCQFIAEADTEEGAVLLMMEHSMMAHPEAVTELLSTMSQDEIKEFMKKKVREEIKTDQA